MHAVATKTEPAGGVTQVLSSQQPGKDAPKDGEDGTSSPVHKPPPGDILLRNVHNFFH